MFAEPLHSWKDNKVALNLRKVSENVYFICQTKKNTKKKQKENFLPGSS